MPKLSRLLEWDFLLFTKCYGLGLASLREFFKPWATSPGVIHTDLSACPAEACGEEIGRETPLQVQKPQLPHPHHGY